MHRLLGEKIWKSAKFLKLLLPSGCQFGGPRGGFLKIISAGILTAPALKQVSRADVGMETGFHAGVGRKSDWNNH